MRWSGREEGLVDVIVVIVCVVVVAGCVLGVVVVVMDAEWEGREGVKKRGKKAFEEVEERRCRLRFPEV